MLLHLLRYKTGQIEQVLTDKCGGCRKHLDQPSPLECERKHQTVLSKLSTNWGNASVWIFQSVRVVAIGIELHRFSNLLLRHQLRWMFMEFSIDGRIR